MYETELYRNGVRLVPGTVAPALLKAGEYEKCDALLAEAERTRVGDAPAAFQCGRTLTYPTTGRVSGMVSHRAQSPRSIHDFPRPPVCADAEELIEAFRTLMNRFYHTHRDSAATLDEDATRNDCAALQARVSKALVAAEKRYAQYETVTADCAVHDARQDNLFADVLALQRKDQQAATRWHALQLERRLQQFGARWQMYLETLPDVPPKARQPWGVALNLQTKPQAVSIEPPRFSVSQLSQAVCHAFG